MKNLFSLLLALALLPMPVQAGDHNQRSEKQHGSNGEKYGGENRGKPLLPPRINAKWKEECGSCHMLFAPGLLPAESWRKMMSGLGKHFGVDASLPAPDAAEITEFLVKNESNRWSAQTAPPRIVDSRWFAAKHGPKDVPPDAWKRPSIKSPANCEACHPDAAKADFNEHRIRIPK